MYDDYIFFDDCSSPSNWFATNFYNAHVFEGGRRSIGATGYRPWYWKISERTYVMPFELHVIPSPTGGRGKAFPPSSSRPFRPTWLVPGLTAAEIPQNRDYGASWRELRIASYKWKRTTALRKSWRPPKRSFAHDGGGRCVSSKSPEGFWLILVPNCVGASCYRGKIVAIQSTHSRARAGKLLEDGRTWREISSKRTGVKRPGRPAAGEGESWTIGKMRGTTDTKGSFSKAIFWPSSDSHWPKLLVVS